MPLAKRRAGEAERLQIGRFEVDAQLLFELADQGGLGQLASFDLAARKLPQAGHLAIGGALLKQYPAVTVRKRGGHHRQCRDFCQNMRSR